MKLVEWLGDPADTIRVHSKIIWRGFKSRVSVSSVLGKHIETRIRSLAVRTQIELPVREWDSQMSSE